MIRVAVDLGGADRPARELVEGALAAAEWLPDLYLHLFAGRGEVAPAVARHPGLSGRVEVTDAPDFVGNGEDPTEGYKLKHGASIYRATGFCGAGGADALVSCGATGAITVGAVMDLGKIPGLSPALLCELRHADGSPFCVVDCGANVDCRAEKLRDFARAGAAYMKAKGVERPSVALLSNGAEDAKGNATTKKAFALLREGVPGFTGNIEGSAVLTSGADVIVCEGFAGNIFLKTAEGAAKAAIRELKALAAGLPDNARSALESAADEVYTRYDYNGEGGAVLLGFGVPVVKGHGAADAHTLRKVTEQAYTLAKNGLAARLRDEFAATPPGAPPRGTGG